MGLAFVDYGGKRVHVYQINWKDIYSIRGEETCLLAEDAAFNVEVETRGEETLRTLNAFALE